MDDTTESQFNVMHRQLEVIRRTGACNMFDAVCVREMAESLGYQELVGLIGYERRHPDYSTLLFSHVPTDLDPEEEAIVAEYQEAF